MLGSNLGKKVTAGVVQDQYKQFLKNKPEEKAKTLTPEERKEAKRAEMRKKGIFVKADDVDEVPTVLEKVDGVVQPMLFVLPEKPTVWKKHKTGTRKAKKEKKAKSVDKKHESEHRKKPKASKSSGKVSIAPPPAEPKPSKPEKKVEKKVVEKSEEDKSQDANEVKVEKKESVKEVKEKVEKSEETPEAVVKVEKKESVKEVKEKESEKEHDPPTITSAPPTSSATSSTTTDPKTTSIPPAEPQRDAFDKLDDDEFEKMTSDADEKDILKHAPKLLKVAKRHAAIEKCLTPHENDTLAKFFSGKQKLDANVLAVLDSALDKIIDYLQKNNCAVDEETKAVMKKRDKLKAAMMKEFLVSPQYLPKTWTAKFNEWKTEAEKQKNGINWFRVLFHYPKHKSFDDGPEDTFGNFRRRHRGFWIGILFGPGDVKSFEDTKREDDCQGMFLDTKTIQDATNEKDTVTGKNSQTSVTGAPPK